MSISELYQHFLECKGVCTDSRKIIKDGIYFSLKGENFNGNKFAQSALEQGCKYAVVDEANYAKNDSIICVEDSLKTLQSLSNFHRNQFDIPVIAITGSNGKTTTKELMFQVLSQKYRVLATKGNLNNHIGVPLSLLSISLKHEIAIIEMGANHMDEIAKLCSLAEPNFGLITNIGKAHIGEFGGWNNIVKAKGELYDYISDKSALVFVNKEDPLLMSLSEDIRKYTYGNQSADLNGKIISSGDALHLNIEDVEVQTHLFGDYNFSNIMAAAAVGTYFKVELELVARALEHYIPQNNRSQLLNTTRNKLILDAYNANPTSMQAALENFEKISNGNSCAILGDMLELGDDSIKEHQMIIDSIEKKQLNAILVGEIFHHINQSNLPAFPNVQEVISSGILKSMKDATVLLKGSRGIELEKLVSEL